MGCQSSKDVVSRIQEQVGVCLLFAINFKGQKD